MKHLLSIIKSFHFWAWLIYIVFTVFAFIYPHVATYSNRIDEAFAPLEWFYIWVMFVAVWTGAYLMTIMLVEF